jgi:membrane-associated protease RseP (regulator of RpoE activity)
VFPEDSVESAQAEPETPQFVTSAAIYRPRKTTPWVHGFLLAATIVTTTLVGADMQFSFRHNLPFFDTDRYAEVFTLGLQSPSLFLSGLPFSLTLLTILLAHEMGHYLTCVFYGVDATLPYFLPSPVPLSGTFGAFIKIRSGIRSRRILFDVAIAGPLAGFIFLIPALGAGLAFSKIMPAPASPNTVALGIPILQWVAEKLIFPGIPASHIFVHPLVRAAWVGMLATSFNLLPVSQLDGGHIGYALLGERQKWVTYPLLAAQLGLLVLAFLAVITEPANSSDAPLAWVGWVMQAFVFTFFFITRRHPPLYDDNRLGGGRARLGVFALVMLIVCLPVLPVA